MTRSEANFETLAVRVKGRAHCRIGGPECPPVKVWDGSNGTTIRTSELVLADYPDETFTVGYRCPHCDARGTYRAEIPALMSSGVDFKCGVIWDDSRSDFKGTRQPGCDERIEALNE